MAMSISGLGQQGVCFSQHEPTGGTNYETEVKIAELLKKSCFGDSQDVRNDALESLIKLRKDVIPLLLEVLQERNPALRVTALKVLSKMGARSSDVLREALPIIRNCLNDNSELVRTVALIELAKMSGIFNPSTKVISNPNEAVSRLIDMLKDKKTILQVRELTAEAIGWLNLSDAERNEAILALQNAAKNDEALSVRLIAQKSLNQITKN